MTSEDERRIETRYDAYLVVSIAKTADALREGGDHVNASHTLDISRNGLQIMLEQPLIAGNTYAIGVETFPEHEHTYLSALVKWVRYREAEHIYLAGIEVSETPADQFAKWTALLTELRNEQETPLDMNALDDIIDDILGANN